MPTIESLITRINALGLAMVVRDGRLVVEGDTRGLTAEERPFLAASKQDLIAYLTTPREHVAILCLHRHPDGRACDEIITVQRESGKVAWCQSCFGTATGRAEHPSDNPDPCYACKRTDWWISIHGKRICRTCHPPAYPALECTDESEIKKVLEQERAKRDKQEEGRSILDNVVPNAPHVVLPLKSIRQETSDRRPVMYVASDLSHWVTDEPGVWAKEVRIQGKLYVRLAPDELVWLYRQVKKVEAACDAGKIDLETFSRIIDAFCPVYEFAVRMGMATSSEV